MSITFTVELLPGSPASESWTLCLVFKLSALCNAESYKSLTVSPAVMLSLLFKQMQQAFAVPLQAVLASHDGKPSLCLCLYHSNNLRTV